MKQIIIGIILAIIIVSAIAVGFLYSKNTIHPNNVVVQAITVSDSKITLKCTSTNSGLGFEGYTTEYRNEVLYIKLKGALISFSKPLQPDITIDNTFGSIKEVYLQGDNSADNVLIYPKK